MFRWLEKQKRRKEAVNNAREAFLSWEHISKSKGWKVYEDCVKKKIEMIKIQFNDNTELEPEDLKKLQLALQVWKTVQRIPKELLNNAKGPKK